MAKNIPIPQTVLPGMPIDPMAEGARKALKSRANVVMLIGRAGTGKSYFIRKLIEDEPEGRNVVLAPTGLAAMNIGGQTVHSYFGFPPRPLIGLDDKPHFLFTKNVRGVKRIIIDEISMLRADVMDAIDLRLRQARRNQEPFGGVQMLLVGDFYQLPPVVRNDEQEMLVDAGYSSPYAFAAKVLRDVQVETFELTLVRRQNDEEFIEILQCLRERRDVQRAGRLLNERCHTAPPLPVRVLLTATNAVADTYNARGMEALQGAPKVYAGDFKGEVPKGFNPADRLPAPQALMLKPGARVIFTQNDPNGDWVNGSLGLVVKLSEDSVHVRLDSNGLTVEAGRASWPQARWVWDEASGTVRAEEQFRYEQFPLSPAWAITIHKSQGMTLESVEVDLGRGAFAPGQTYVALSRATSLAGLRLTRPLTPRDVQVDPAIAEGLARLS